MRKTFCLALGMVMAMGCMAQREQRVVSNGEQSVVYYMPKTEIALTVHYSEETYVAGPYAEYAEELLGLKNVLPHDTVIRHFLKLQTGTRTTADLDRVYKIQPEKGMDYQCVAIDAKGLLAGYNTKVYEKTGSSNRSQENNNVKPVKRDFALPLSEDALSAESEEDRAMAVVEQILVLREDRLRLLSGNLRNMPTDGAGIDRMLDEMEKQEKALVALFAGRHVYRPVEETIYYSPEMSTEVMLGELRLVVETMPQFTKAATVDKKKQKTAAPSPICYNLPGKAHYAVFRGDDKLAERTIDVAQLGVSVALPAELFVKGNKTKIEINTKTGNIKSIVVK